MHPEVDFWTFKNMTISASVTLTKRKEHLKGTLKRDFEKKEVWKGNLNAYAHLKSIFKGFVNAYAYLKGNMKGKV